LKIDSVFGAGFAIESPRGVLFDKRQHPFSYKQKKNDYTDPVSAGIIICRERSLTMLKNDLMLRNPLSAMGLTLEEILPAGGFGAVLSRAGVGKTAFMVQLGIYALSQSINVLHISLDDPVQKISLWYKEVFQRLGEPYENEQVKGLWDLILPYRFIMTFKIGRFSAPVLEERLTDLREQKIFNPDMIIIDGMPIDGSIKQSLDDLKTLAEEYSIRIWFTAQTHRSEDPAPDGLPVFMQQVGDWFDFVLQLNPERGKIHVNALKGGFGLSDSVSLFLDPATMLVKENV